MFTRAGSERLATWNPHSGPTAVNKSSSYKGGGNSDEVMAKETLCPLRIPWNILPASVHRVGHARTQPDAADV